MLWKQSPSHWLPREWLALALRNRQYYSTDIEITRIPQTVGQIRKVVLASRLMGRPQEAWDATKREELLVLR